MDTAAPNSEFLNADTFLRTDQSAFGNAWRYELVHGAIVAHTSLEPRRMDTPIPRVELAPTA
jgi:hypothetical protein